MDNKIKTNDYGLSPETETIFNDVCKKISNPENLCSLGELYKGIKESESISNIGVFLRQISKETSISNDPLLSVNINHRLQQLYKYWSEGQGNLDNLGLVKYKSELQYYNGLKLENNMDKIEEVHSIYNKFIDLLPVADEKKSEIKKKELKEILDRVEVFDYIEKDKNFEKTKAVDDYLKEFSLSEFKNESFLIGQIEKDLKLVAKNLRRNDGSLSEKEEDRFVKTICRYGSYIPMGVGKEKKMEEVYDICSGFAKAIPDEDFSNRICERLESSKEFGKIVLKKKEILNENLQQIGFFLDAQKKSSGK